MTETMEPNSPEQNELPDDVIPASRLRVITPNKHIVLADDTSYKGQVGKSSDSRNIWVYVYPESGVTMAELFPVFNDPSKTRRIENWTVDTLDPTVYEGYTSMTSIKTDYSGQVSIRLDRE